MAEGVVGRQPLPAGVRDSPLFLRAVLDSLDAHIAVLDASGCIVGVNASWDRFAAANDLDPSACGVGTNYLEACDRSSEAAARDSAQGIRDVLAGRRGHFSLEYPCHSPSEQRWFVLRATRFDGSAVVCHENVTERVLAERSARRSERLASIGHLAAGLADEINNPLGAILLAARAAQGRPKEPERVARLLETILENTQRCTGVVDSLVRFARGGAEVRLPCDLNELVSDAASLLKPWADMRAVRLLFEPSTDAPTVRAAAHDLLQAFFNLGVNAIHSCARGGSVRLSVQLTNDRVSVRVADDGRGMTDREQAHVFDPFYSTRLQEGASGLGLALCHGTIRSHGGTIELDSRPGMGTNFTVELPAEIETARASATAGAPSPARTRPSQRRP